MTLKRCPTFDGLPLNQGILRTIAAETLDTQLYVNDQEGHFNTFAERVSQGIYTRGIETHFALAQAMAHPELQCLQNYAGVWPLSAFARIWLRNQ